MKIAVYTSLTAAYLPNGRILANSVKKIHPDWDFFLLYNDRSFKGLEFDKEPFDNVVFAEWLPINRPWREWASQYSVVEFCTATKGVMSQYLFSNYDYDWVIYLDPDICVFSPMGELLEMMSRDQCSVVLTPHLTDPESDAYAIWSHEIAALKHGTFNLGFYAIANDQNGRAYLDWWADRLLDYSHINFQLGTFTDQKWANLAPYMFDGIQVLTERSYNVATWNMTNRKITKDRSGQWFVNDLPLRFYHFSGFGNNFEWADGELEKLAGDDHVLRSLWDHYKELYKQHALQEPAP